MLSFRPVLMINGALLLILAGAMMLAMFVDFAFGDNAWPAFLTSAFLTAFSGGILYLTNRSNTLNLTVRETFLTTASSWFLLPAFAALPFCLSDLSASFTDGYFESTSGLTTTGSTVFTGLDTMDHGLLLWRALLQGLGGVGMIVLGMAILPVLRVGGMQLFRTESASDKVIPQAGALAKTVGITYLTMVAISSTVLWILGMGGFDAICHAFAAISTGGLSTYDSSVGHFNDPAIEVAITLSMLAGALPMMLYFQMLHGKPLALVKDIQVHVFLGIYAVATCIVLLWLVIMRDFDFLTALRHSSFNIASVITTTGFASTDYMQWGGVATLVFFFITALGGATGSTTGGIKAFRLIVLYEISKVQLYRLVQPHGVFIPRYDGKPIPDSAAASVLSFFALFAFSFLALATGLSCFGLDFITSMSGAVEALSNAGPGLGDIIGPAGNFKPLPDGAKWLLSIGMIVGRLELFTVLVLFTKVFWRD